MDRFAAAFEYSVLNMLLCNYPHCAVIESTKLGAKLIGVSDFAVQYIMELSAGEFSHGPWLIVVLHSAETQAQRTSRVEQKQENDLTARHQLNLHTVAHCSLVTALST